MPAVLGGGMNFVFSRGEDFMDCEIISFNALQTFCKSCVVASAQNPPTKKGASMRRFFSILPVLMVVALVLTACGGAPPVTEPPAATAPATQPPATEPPAAGPLVLKTANTANITTWDPVASFSTEAAYLANVYEQLLRINPPSSAEQYTPLLATSWEVIADGLSWTFHLRDGVKFHDGESMNAGAVQQSQEG